MTMKQSARQIRVCVVVLALVVSWKTSAEVAGDNNVIARINQLTPKLVSTIARIGEERRISVPSNTDILKTVADYCGSANARRYYLPIFLAANAANEDIRAGRTKLTSAAEMRLPACVYSDEAPAIVFAGVDGPQWGNPISLPTWALPERQDPPDQGTGWFPFPWPGPSKSPKWLRQHQPSLPDLTLDPKPLPGQSVDYARLMGPTAASTLPGSIDDLGAAAVWQFDDDRLLDTRVKSTYDRLLATVLASVDDTGGFSTKSTKNDVALWSSAFERATRTQDVLAANGPVDWTRLERGRMLLSSGFLPGNYSITLKTGIDPKAAAREVLAALPPAQQASVTLNSRYVPYFAEPQSGSEPCPSPVAGQWPINTDELRKVLEYRRVAENLPTAGKLLIFDTGFPPGKVANAPFTPAYFVRKVGKVTDLQNEPYLWTTTHPAEPAEYFHPRAKYANHGVGVLTLALGGVDVLKQNLLASHVVSQNGYVISLMGYKLMRETRELAVNGDAVLQSLSGANWGQAAVVGVNLSLRFNMEVVSNTYESMLKDRPNVLYVFAAGNDGEDLAGWEVHPAGWGGDRNGNAITVGAADAGGRYWARSNRGAARVDLAAPGCDVPSLQWNADLNRFEEVKLSGTSFAAPLVSFAGNLLRELADPIRIKSRILYSARYSPELQGKVRSFRMLDIPTALALPFDTVRDASGLRLGQIIWPEAGRSICGKIKKRDEIAQLHLARFKVDDGQTDKVSAVYRKMDIRHVDFGELCSLIKPELSEIIFREAKIEDGRLVLKEAEKLDLREILSVTFCDMCRSWLD